MFLALIFPMTLVPFNPATFLHDFQNKFMDMDKHKNGASVSHQFHKKEKLVQKSLEIRTGYLVPLDYFLINLSQKQGQKLFKVDVELNVDNLEIQAEINRRMLQVRDIIIILVSSKKYEQIETLEGQEILKQEIRDTINSFLTKGKINRVLFTEFIEA